MNPINLLNRVHNRLFGWVSIGVMLFLSAATVSNAQESNLTDVVFSKLAGDDVQINIIADAPLDRPGAFSTDTPARIALDFFGMKSQLKSAQTLVESGLVKSIVAVETSDRTRVIINLYESARFSVKESDNGYSVTVFKGDADYGVAVRPKPYVKKADVLPSTRVSKIDFRRSEAGGGTLIVDIDGEDFAVDSRQRDGEIIVDLLGVSLPAEFEQSLDVRDFATPVSKVDSFQSADSTRLIVVPQGKYQHLSFQSGGRFTLIVDPIIETEDDVRNKDDLALGFEGERLSINFQNIDVRSALAVIADFTGINFVTSDSVGGELSLNLKDVPWDQALDVILRTKGLAQRKTGNVVWIAPSGEIQRYEENELKANAVAAEFAPLTTEVITINYAKAKDIADVIKSVKVVAQGNVSSDVAVSSGAIGVSATETDKNSLLSARGSVTVDERTNSLLVQDVADYIVDLRKVIAKLDKPVRQVLIETRIVEANDSFSRELGARLGFQRITPDAQFPGVNDSNIGTVIGSGTIGGVTTLSNSYYEGQQELEEAALNSEEIVAPALEFETGTGGLAVDLGANGIGTSQAASYAIDIFKLGSGFTNLITLELSALEADGRGKIVASPRLVTANQKQARISQGNEVYVTVDGNSDGSGGGVESIQAVLELIVTPQITPDDRVIMDVDIRQDQLVAATADITTLGTKEIQTQILADNGETVVIGGIYQEVDSTGTTKVPLLGDVPVLGNLFKKKSRDSRKTELLIFLTPKIISPKLNLG